MGRSYRDSSVTRIEIAQPRDSSVPFVIDDNTIAFNLGFRLQILWYFILKPEKAYRRFEIPKANGKMREVFAPSGPMKAMLSRLRSIFLLPLVGKLGGHVTAYRIGRGARDATQRHLFDCPVCCQHDAAHTCSYELTQHGASYTVHKSGDCLACLSPRKHENCPRRGVKVHMDLKDFFPNTRTSWIREYFQAVIGYNYWAASTLASLMTVRMQRKMRDGKVRSWRGVPQGAPTSGDICNLVADWRLDQPLLKALEGSGWRYTRYADDLYFSHPDNLPGERVTDLIRTVGKYVREAGWRLNDVKLRVQRPGRNQRHLGMTLNQKPNIPRQEYMRIRATIQQCWFRGFDAMAAQNDKPSGSALLSWLTGKLAWYETINEGKTARLRVVLNAAKDRHVTRIDRSHEAA